MVKKKKQLICAIISLCLLFSSFCFGNLETDFFCVQENGISRNVSFSTEYLSIHDDIYFQQNIKETGGTASSQLYFKNRKNGSNNRNVLVLGFSNNIITSLFLLFFLILNRVNIDNINLSNVNILRFIHDKDGKK